MGKFVQLVVDGLSTGSAGLACDARKSDTNYYRHADNLSLTL